MKLYIAGKISDTVGYVQKFATAADEVRAMGDEPVNPCEIHHEGNCCSHATWEQWMVCDLKAMLDCDGVYALRDWYASKGASIEVNLAIKLNKTIIYQGEFK